MTRNQGTERGSSPLSVFIETDSLTLLFKGVPCFRYPAKCNSWEHTSCDDAIKVDRPWHNLRDQTSNDREVIKVDNLDITRGAER